MNVSIDQYYDQGWGARWAGKPFNPRATLDWRDGWKDADGVDEETRYQGVLTLNKLSIGTKVP